MSQFPVWLLGTSERDKQENKMKNEKNWLCQQSFFPFIFLLFLSNQIAQRGKKNINPNALFG
jgi:hypothetical protein